MAKLLIAVAIVLSVLFAAVPFASAADYTLHLIPNGSAFPSWMCNDATNSCVLTAEVRGYVNVRAWANSTIVSNGETMVSFRCDAATSDLCVSMPVQAGGKVTVTNSSVVYASLTPAPAFRVNWKYSLFVPMVLR